VTGQMYESLIAFKKGTTQIRPALAERWHISADGLTYTFFLRKGVKWHSNDAFKPTRDFNADDVLFSIKRQWLPDHPYFNISSAQHPYFNDMNMGQVLAAVEKLNSHTVVIRVKRPIAPLLANLAMPWANIYSAEYAQALLKQGLPERVDEQPIGTGPFQFVSYEKDIAVKYKAFHSYWAGQPKLDELVFLIQPDSSVRLAHLQAGMCQVLAYPNPADLNKITKSSDLKLLSQTGLNVGYLAYNTEKNRLTMFGCAAPSIWRSIKEGYCVRFIATPQCLRPIHSLQFNGVTAVKSMRMYTIHGVPCCCWPRLVIRMALKLNCGPCPCHALTCQMHRLWPS
jgi:dipeptide transport system substrate-binding protein